MDAQYILNNISFEWDSRKAATNLRKHKVSFELACEVFFDPFVCYFDEEEVDGELRESIIGLTSNWRLLFVVYVMREDSVRIISARLATNSERDFYENQ